LRSKLLAKLEEKPDAQDLYQLRQELREATARAAE